MSHRVTSLASYRMIAGRFVGRRLPLRLPAALRAQPHFIQSRAMITKKELAEYADPGKSDWVNPPAIPRSKRDPYGDWWDKQERRNFGEPVHEDNDVLGILSLHDYDHFTPGWGLVLWGCFLTVAGGIVYATSFVYPDKVSAPRTFEDGLEAELGGKRAVRARKHGEDTW